MVRFTRPSPDVTYQNYCFSSNRFNFSSAKSNKKYVKEIQKL